MPEYRRADGEIRLLEGSNDLIFPVELWLYNDVDNRNNWRFVNLEQHRADWAGKPILIAYINGGKGIGDGHNAEVGKDAKTGEPVASFTGATAERIVGAISEKSDDIRLERENDKTWVVAKGFLWAWYARELVEKIVHDAGQGREMSVSIEALVSESHMDGDIEVETKYQPLGVTILGDHVMPAVEDAHIAMLSAQDGEFKKLKIKAASYMERKSAAKEEKNEKKGMRELMRYSKQQIRELQAKFGTTYTVLAAVETEENGVLVCLMSTSGKMAIYKMASADEAVVPERIVEVNTHVHFCASGFDDVLVDSCDVYETLSTSNADLTERLNSTQSELDGCKSTISAMRDAENKRRVSAAKIVAINTLNAFNMNRSEKVDAKVLASVNQDIEGGVYTACADKDGNWIGDNAVREKVLAICASAVMELDKAAAEREKKEFVWNRLSKTAQDDGSIEALLARKGINA